jgi:NADH-quinone oxidoreductase subunit A
MEQIHNPLAESFAPIAFMVVMSVATGLGILLLSTLLGNSRKSTADETIYECGLDPMDAPTKKFTVDFYVVAMLFILFDVEIALLIPWAIYFGGVADTVALKWVAFADFLVFVAILVAGYVYLYRAGAFDWSALSRRARRLKLAEKAGKRAA